VTVVERAPTVGGLAGSFEVEGRFYPLGYHHILHRDRTLLFFLDRIGALPRVRWRRIRMLFETAGRLHDLGTVGGFLRFPMTTGDKLLFVRLMLAAFVKKDWSDWSGRSAADLVDAWGSPGVRKALFEPLTRLKFELPCEDVSGAWLGARLHFREGSAPLGYIPGANWTKVLCDGLCRLLEEAGVRLRLGTTVVSVRPRGDRIEAIETGQGERLAADVFVSAFPTEVYSSLVPEDRTPYLTSIRYTALISAVCTTQQRIEPACYWTNLSSLRHTACGIFLLTSLNPTIGGPGDACVNFVTHLQDRHRALFRASDEELMGLYRDDFRCIFGLELDPSWTHIERVPMYSPVFVRDYRNPAVRSATWSNVYFAGNYRTFPSVASTGTALWSGLECGRALLRDHGKDSDLPAAVQAFRLRSHPRG
jgi:protoporphyrinogen oxidase